MNPILSMGNYPQGVLAPTWDNAHMPTPLAENLLRLRTAAGLDAKTLSKAAGLNATYVRDIEDGRTLNPSFVNLSKLAQALRVSIVDLTGTSGLKEAQQLFDIPRPHSNTAEEFAATQTRVAAHMRTTGKRVTQADIARHTLAVWHALQDLPARMSFADRLAFTMSEFNSKHPPRFDLAAISDDENG